MRCRPTFFLVATWLIIPQLLAQNGGGFVPASHPKPWQVAGIRAAFGDARSPNPELSPNAQREALKLCAAHGWGEALDPREVAVYLTSKDAALRISAAWALGQMGERGVAFAKELATSLDHDEIRQSAPPIMAALGRRAISDMLADPDPRIRRAAVGAMAEFRDVPGPDGKLLPGVAEEAAQLLADQDSSVRLAAALALTNMGKDGEACAAKISALLAGEKDQERYVLLVYLSSFTPGNASYAKEIAASLNSSDARIRSMAARALGGMGPSAAPYAAQIAGLLTDSEFIPRAQAVNALGHLGPIGAPFAKQIAAALRDPQRSVRWSAAWALGNIGVEGSKFAGNVAELLSDPDENARVTSLDSLAKMGAAGAAYAPDAAKLLDAESRYVRDAAISALVQMGEEGAAFAPQVTRKANDEFPGRSWDSSAAFLRATASLLEDQKAEQRRAAAFFLARTGSSAAPFVPNLAEHLSDADVEVRAAAAVALGILAKSGTIDMSQIAKLLADDAAEVRASALRAFAQLTRDDRKSQEYIRPMLGDSSADVRRVAISWLKIDGGADDALKEVVPLLRDKDDAVRLRTILKLDEVDRLNPSLIGSLVPLLLDGQGFVARSAFDFFDHRGNVEGNLDLQAAILATAYVIPAKERASFRAHLRLWAGDNSEMQRSVTWFGNSDYDPIPKEGLTPEESQDVLGLARDLWDHSAGKNALRTEIVERIAQLAEAIPTKPDAETTKVLEALREKLGSDDVAAKATEAIRKVLEKQ